MTLLLAIELPIDWKLIVAIAIVVMALLLPSGRRRVTRWGPMICPNCGHQLNRLKRGGLKPGMIEETCPSCGWRRGTPEVG